MACFERDWPCTVGIEQARRAIDINLSDAFDSTYNDLVHQLEAGKTKEDMFSSKITEMAKTLSAPLEEEKISTTFNRDGQRIQQTVEIGKKMVQFKKNVAKDKKRLDENWKQWDELQSEFEEFGMEVFGKECFPAASAHPQQLRRGQEGFKHEMELLDLEHSTKSSEILAEIEGIVIETTQKKDAQEEVSSKPFSYISHIKMTLGTQRCFASRAAEYLEGVDASILRGDCIHWLRSLPCYDAEDTLGIAGLFTIILCLSRKIGGSYF